VQLDEKWSFVERKEKNASPENHDRCGDNWDHVALDPEHRLVLAVTNGKRSARKIREALEQVKRIMGGRTPRLITTDEYRAYRDEILHAYGRRISLPRRHPQGRPPLSCRAAPPELVYATVHKTRRNGTVVKVEPRLQFGTPAQLQAALAASTASRAVNTAFVERQNGTDRHRNSRKIRKSYRFSKDWDLHNAASLFSLYAYNFCWPVRTLRVKDTDNRWRSRTPAMSAGLSDHVWTIREWALFPVCTS
jgi:hypothetical protein